MFYDFTICRQCFMEGFEGSSMAGAGNSKVCAGISKTGYIVIWTSYVTGMTFANQLGLTTQVPAIIEIVTNREATNGRTVTVGNQKVRIKKAAVTVSYNNADILQFLDCVGQAEKYTELSMERTIEIMSAYVKGKVFTREQLAGVASGMTGAVAKKLIEWGLVYEFGLC